MRILIANPYGIGDVLFSLPLVRAVRQADPSGTVGYISNIRTAEILSAWGELGWRGVFEKDDFRRAWKRSKKEGLRHLRSIVEEVRRQRFDALVDLSLGWHYALAGWWAGIPRRVGFDFRQRGRHLTHRLRLPSFQSQPVAEYYLDLLPLIGLPRPVGTDARMEVPAAAKSEAEEFLRRRGVPPGPLAGIIPGGGASWGPNAVFKQWAPDRFARVADALAERTGGSALILGDAGETGLCRQVASSMKSRRGFDMQPGSLLLLAALLQRCSLVVGNDSGPMHLAALVGTPTVSVFGPVDPSVYGPFTFRPMHRVATHGLACQPCYQNFRFPACPWNNRCLKGLQPERVLEQVDAVLS